MIVYSGEVESGSREEKSVSPFCARKIERSTAA
jgi:hypothetical protein